MFTVCPKCALTLVVTAGDLRVAQGYVRCGRCSNVFNALSRLAEDRQADLIAVEDLKVSNMVRHPTLARSIADASWSRFLWMLDYKVEKTGGPPHSSRSEKFQSEMLRLW